MNKIVEEALTNMIKRIEVLEEKISRLSVPDKRGFHPTKKESKPGMITEGQLNFIKGLERDLGMQGESRYAEMTLRESSDYINKLKAMKEQKNTEQKIKPQIINLDKLSREEIEEMKEHLKEETKPLTKKEIEEIGEEALL